MQSWLGLNLTNISVWQFLGILGVWIGTWLVWHGLALAFHVCIEKYMPAKLRADLSFREGHTGSHFNLPNDFDVRAWIHDNKKGYFYYFIYISKFSSKTKVALTAVTTWGLTKFWILNWGDKSEVVDAVNAVEILGTITEMIRRFYM